MNNYTIKYDELTAEEFLYLWNSVWDEAPSIDQVKLAMDAEVSQQSITFYETGSRVPSLDVAYRLAKVLDCSIDYLIGNDEKLVNAYYELGDKEYDSLSMIAADDNKK